MSQPEKEPETSGAIPPGAAPRAQAPSDSDPEATIWSPRPDPEATIVATPAEIAAATGSESDTVVDPEETIVAAPAVPVPERAGDPEETMVEGPAAPSPGPEATMAFLPGAASADGSFSLDEGYRGLPGQASVAGGGPGRVSAGPAGQASLPGGASGVSWSASKSFWTSSLGIGRPEAAADSPHGAAGGRVVAGYEILGELGRGGMGVVYKARQLGLNRTVALKMVLSGMHSGPEQLARFVAEAQAVAKLHHPNIVQIYEVGNEESGIPFFSLEFVPGGTLSEKLGGKPLPEREAARLLETIARAVDYAHEGGIVHRDLKPGNILLAPDGTPKIADFGLAKRIDVEAAEDGTATRSGAIMGSPSYMAPEQAMGDLDRIGPGTDVYALGSMLFEMIAGRPPFLAAKVLDILEQVRSQEPVPPSRLQPKVSADLETICLKCLQKDPNRRYLSARDLADDLRRHLDGKPILARPVSSWERAWRWCRRNPRVASLLGLVAVLLTTLAIGGPIAAFQIQSKRVRAEIAEKSAIAQAEIAQKNATVAEEQSNLVVQNLYQLARNIQTRISKDGTQQQLRQDLLQQALDGLNRAVATGSNSSLLGRTRVAAAQQMGDIAYDLGRAEEALGHYLKAREFSEAMWSQDPDNEIAIWNEATLNRKIGEVNLDLKGDTAAALAAFREAAEGRSRLTKMTLEAYKKNQGPSPALVRRILGEDYGRLGDMALRAGDPAGAWAAAQKGVELLAGKGHAAPAGYLAALKAGGLPKELAASRSLAPMAVYSFHLGDRATAAELGEAAVSRAEADLASTKTPEDGTRLRLELASSLLTRGDLEVLAGRPKEALAFYDRAESLHAAQAKQAGESSRIQGDLSSDAFRKATVHQLLGDHAASLREALRSLGYREAMYRKEPGNNLRQGTLAFALARADRPADAAKLLEPLKARAANDPGMLFLTAGGYAICSESPAASADDRASYRKTAIGLLTQAIGKGYRDKVALETDPDLTGLRQDPAFRLLMK